MFQKKLNKAFELLRKGQFTEFVTRTIGYLPGHFVTIDRTLLLARDVTCDAGVTAHPAIYFRQASMSDLNEILKCAGQTQSELAGRIFRIFFEGNHHCYLLEEQGQVVAFCWAFFNEYTLTFDAYKDTALRLQLASQTAFIGNAFVNDRHRRRGFYSLLFNEVARELVAAAQTRRIFAIVRPANTPSLNAHLKLGFSTVGGYMLLSIGSLQFVLATQSRIKYRIHAPTASIPCME